jgi:dipeptidase D
LLFTVDEETGLGGALRLDASLLSGSLMLNLDTEDWQELFIGCAGGGGWEFGRRFAVAPLADGAQPWQLTISGLAGGHSGIQIHEQLGNAIKLLGQALQGIEGVQLARADVGVAHNVIPREGYVAFAAPAGSGEQLASRFAQLQAQWLDYLPAADSALELTLKPAQLGPLLSAADSQRVLDLLAALPHGPQAFNLAKPAELVDLSINLARFALDAGELSLESSYRFFNEAQSLPLCESVLAIARAWELTVESIDGYPGWEPDFDSPLLEQACVLHAELFGQRPAVKAIHAGLECGILKGKKPDMDILSFGPTIRGAHSPTERLQIDTVGPFWRFLTTLLERL